MREDEAGPPKDQLEADRQDDAPPPPPYDPDYELIGYLEEKEAKARTWRRPT
ncbi:hypothetical protein BH23ACT12_BH23ACT12_23560 [soil metagenome]